MTGDPSTDSGPARHPRKTARRVLGCLGLIILLLVSPVILLVGFVVADKIVFALSGDCVPAPMTSDACRGAYAFDVWNRTSETLDIVAIRGDGPEIPVLRGVGPGMFGPNDNFTVEGGKCEPTLHLIARTTEGRVVAERTGICRREDWVVTEP